MPCLAANFLRCANEYGSPIDCKYTTMLPAFISPLELAFSFVVGFLLLVDVFVLNVLLTLNLALNCAHVPPLLPALKYCGQSLPFAVLCWMTLLALMPYLLISCFVKSTALSIAFLKFPSELTQISMPMDSLLYFVLPACQH